MDSKNFIQILSKRLDAEGKTTGRYIASLGQIIGEICRDGDSVAVPSFGTFSPDMQPEEIRVDHSSGKRVLCPPEITIVFTPAASVIKNIHK